MKKLRRPKEGKKLMGVCSAFGNFFEINVTYVRIAFLAFCLFPPISTIAAVVAYIGLGLIIPEDKDYIDV